MYDKVSKVCVFVFFENIWFSKIEDFYKFLVSLGCGVVIRLFKIWYDFVLVIRG